MFLVGLGNFGPTYAGTMSVSMSDSPTAEGNLQEFAYKYFFCKLVPVVVRFGGEKGRELVQTMSRCGGSTYFEDVVRLSVELLRVSSNPELSEPLKLFLRDLYSGAVDGSRRHLEEKKLELEKAQNVLKEVEAAKKELEEEKERFEGGLEERKAEVDGMEHGTKKVASQVQEMEERLAELKKHLDQLNKDKNTKLLAQETSKVEHETRVRRINVRIRREKMKLQSSPLSDLEKEVQSARELYESRLALFEM